MNYTNKNSLFAVGAAVGIVFTLWLGWIGLQNLKADGGPGNVGSQTEEEPQLGSASSPSVVDGCMEVSGVTTCYRSASMNNASTTCALRSPAATSTLAVATAKFTNTFGGTFDFEVGKGTNIYATTTRLGYASAAVSSGSIGSFIVATSTAPGAIGVDQNFVVAPSTYVNFKVGSSSPTLRGTCNAEFRVI